MKWMKKTKKVFLSFAKEKFAELLNQFEEVSEIIFLLREGCGGANLSSNLSFTA